MCVRVRVCVLLGSDAEVGVRCNSFYVFCELAVCYEIVILFVRACEFAMHFWPCTVHVASMHGIHGWVAH